MTKAKPAVKDLPADKSGKVKGGFRVKTVKGQTSQRGGNTYGGSASSGG